MHSDLYAHIEGGKISPPTPYTLHPTPYTLHPTPYTVYPEAFGDGLVHTMANLFAQIETHALIKREHIL